MRKAGSIVWLLSMILFSCAPERQDEQVHEDHAGHEMAEGEQHLSDQQVQLGNIIVDSLRERTLGDELLMTGTVVVDQTKTTSVASRVMGRIEKLYFKNAGERVAKGDVLYEIYSEDLNIAIRELRLAAEKAAILKNEEVDMQAILEGVRTRIRLYGLSENQIKDLEKRKDMDQTVKIQSPAAGIVTSVDVKEGEYVMEGASILYLADLSTLWVEAQVFAAHMRFVKSGMTGRVTFPGLPEMEVESPVSFINPELNSASGINRARIQLSNEKGRLRPGMQAYISVLTKEVRALALPTDAIILDGKGATVWIQTGENRYKSKMVRTGLESHGYTQITEGLEKGERVVVSGAYLLNSEYIFKKGTNPMEGHDMSKM